MYSKKLAFSFFTVPALGKSKSPYPILFLPHLGCKSAGPPGIRVPEPPQARQDKRDQEKVRIILVIPLFLAFAKSESLIFMFRLANLSQEAVDITPKNAGSFPWTASKQSTA
jgi:hypothetical protein